MGKKWYHSIEHDNDLMLEGMHYDVFEMLMTCMNLDPSEIIEIDATADKNEIGLLPTGDIIPLE